jgi:hypothetical protein
VPDDSQEGRRRRASRLREEIARLRKGAPREPSSPREFVERAGRAPDEDADEQVEREPDAPQD